MQKLHVSDITPDTPVDAMIYGKNGEYLPYANPKVDITHEYEAHKGTIWVVMKKDFSRLFNYNKHADNPSQLQLIDECVAVGHVGMIQGIRKWSPDFKTKVNTFVYQNIKWAIMSYLRRDGVFNRHEFPDRNKDEGDKLNDFIDPEYLIKLEKDQTEKYKDKLKREYKKLRERLDEPNRKVLRWHLKGLNLTEVGKKLGICKERVRQRLNMIRAVAQGKPNPKKIVKKTRKKQQVV